ncbi:MAG: DEAD/DEAH box helicase, partial [Arenibacter algicola]|nr:DEAD/DEAH box helicase [Arenibacter algicola]
MSKQFSDLGINEHLLQSLIDQQISEPTDIQKKMIPVILEQNKDVIALAKTGQGKTDALVFPFLQFIENNNNIFPSKKL